MNDPEEAHSSGEGSSRLWIWLGRAGGPAAALATYLLLAGFAEELSDRGRATAAIGVLMAVLWLTEALPLAATALLPIVLFPVAGVVPIEQATAPYADKIIFLFMGSFLLALAMERCGLHRRIALWITLVSGTRPASLVAGVMAASAFLSMWISNTATAAMMLPIGLGLVGLQRTDSKDGGKDLESARMTTCMLLAIAYACSIGGTATPIGTPPNLLLKGLLKTSLGIELGFGQWMLLGVPFAAVFLAATWLILTRWLFPLPKERIREGRDLIKRELVELGRMTRAEGIVLTVFLMAVAGWSLRDLVVASNLLGALTEIVTSMDDAMVAVGAALLLFAVPTDLRNLRPVLDWGAAQRLPWGTLVLFGGGLSLAHAVKSSGLDAWFAQIVGGVRGMPAPVVVVVVTGFVIFLTELTSNTATAATFLPILLGAAQGLQMDPLLLAVPAALASSCAFMLPVATPPNAVVFGSGKIPLRSMIRAGVWLNVAGVVLITLLIYTLGRWALNVRT